MFETGRQARIDSYSDDSSSPIGAGIRAERIDPRLRPSRRLPAPRDRLMVAAVVAGLGQVEVVFDVLQAAVPGLGNAPLEVSKRHVPLSLTIARRPRPRLRCWRVMAGIVDIAAQTAQGQRALISWFRFRPGDGRDGGGWRHRRGSWRRRGSAGDGRWGAGPPELERGDCRGYGDESGRDEEGQAVPGDQGAVRGARAGVGDGGERRESGGRAYLPARSPIRPPVNSREP